MAERAKDKTFTAKSLFEGLSGSQLTAGALAAVTSMLLSAQIGIAGSVIGVAVGSVVSTVASQVYKRFLEQSADKLRGMRDADGEGVAELQVNEEAASPSARIEEIAAGEGGGSPLGDAQSLQGEGSTRRGETSLFPAAGAGVTPIAGRATATPHLGDASLAQDITAQHVQAKRAHDRRMQRGVIAVSIVSALIAVAVSAGFVMLTTQGQGLGTKPASIEQVVRAAQDSGSSQSSEADEQTGTKSEMSGDSQSATSEDASKGDSSQSQATSQGESGNDQSGTQGSSQGQTGSSTSAGSGSSSSNGSGTSSSENQGSSSGESASSGQGSASGSSSSSSGSATSSSSK